jgi:predicted CopG family antitoxin
MVAADKLKMVRVDDDVHKRLAEIGKYSESLSDIIKRVMDELEECKRNRIKK